MPPVPPSEAQAPLSFGIVIHTYRRVPYLRDCLDSLQAQTRPPENIWVAVRADDALTFKYLESRTDANLHVLAVPAAGLIAALDRILPEAREDVLCLLDDDALAPPDWLEKIVRAMTEQPDIGAFGGRDLAHRGGLPIEVSPTDEVGLITDWGAFIGNHHCPPLQLGARDVDFLKVSNMAFRRALVPCRMDSRLFGNATHAEVDLCMGIAAQGYRVVYDPNVTVMHHIDAPYTLEPFSDKRGLIRDRWTAMCHNRLLVLGKHKQGLSGVWLLLAHIAWVIPHLAVEKYGFWDGLCQWPRLTLAAWTGWWTGRKPIGHLQALPMTRQEGLLQQAQ